MNAGELFAGATIDTARRALTARFKTHDIDSAELDARLLVGAALGLDLTGLIVAAARVLTPDEADRLAALAKRRLAGEPVARILGVREFWGLPLHLSAETLVPRPDTETVVEAALDVLRARPAGGPIVLADIGTGSGAILLALLTEWPAAFGIGTDISLSALRTAQANAVSLGLANRAGFVACDFCAALSGGFDLIVSNPPYISSREIASLATEVRDHDPLRALDGGADGLDAYRQIVPEAARRLSPGGALVVEIGQGQGQDVGALMAAAGLTVVEPPRPDLSGIFRAVTGWKPSP
ncbi:MULTISPECIES: peptide chain release factor N(5)-glutamine methyltransferase [Rhodopseudomonas]|uniref:Release factor glutamine methyltransferase n=1 Tax=Rhodopseudomonas palustris TaxID=1076 RepID=A0A0D7F3H4_RHOPL|nr:MULTISPECIES: peptide chain release factor N(5)-glutamine methyltransferase [Rhodopseudomonas]KIZ47376.1 SAM-dependent methyltransferase [Rhodopseudomonas palustris]MDF3814101.1 peptide chain release factor N(5)-glutamine methyltransferase [Rhodopseudomonas sp. BAL398]WOK16880.1 peptide chain release factor N(5)-glutamine methyltransferase [Rhodopseudomonas sp. BAL398]